jgi:WD40 repeat protein
MEYIEGRSLDIWLRQRHNDPLNQDLALEWLQQILTILHVIHREGLIHRDIKPSNIMLTASGQLVLIDFGAVRDTAVTYLQSQGTGNTATRIFAAGYTPHEQVEGRACPESDFFALGRTFVHLMSGIHPMAMEMDDKTGKLMWREYVPNISEWLASLLDAMMESFPGNRPQSARQILEQLQGTSLYISVTPPIIDSSPEPEDVDPWAGFPPSLSPDDWANVRVKRVLQGHRDQIRAIAMHPDSGILVSASFDGTIKLWLLPDGTPITTFEKHTKRITAVAVSDDGMTIASGGYDRHVRLWSLSDGEELHQFQRQPDTIQAVVFVPQKPMIISATGTAVKLWSTQSGKLIAALPHRFKSIRSLAISPDGSVLAVGSLSGTMELWNPFSRKRIWQTSYQLDGTTSVCFSPNGTTLVCATGANIELLSLQRKRLGLLESRQPRALNAIAFSPDGQVLASASGHSIELWSIARKKRLSPPLINHQKPVRSLAFTPNGHMLVSGGSDQKLVLWQPVRH